MVTLNRCPAELEICVSRGDSDPLIFDLVDDAGAPFDATGYTYLLTTNTEADPLDATNEVFQVAGVVALSVVSFPVSPANNETAAFLFADIQETSPGGTILTLAKGTYEIRQDITK